MRPFIAVLLSLSLTACPAPKSKPAPAGPAVPSASPSATATGIAAPEPTATAEPAPSSPTDLVGVWTTVDDQGQLFDIVIFPNGQAVTTWTKGKDGAQGERGFWRKESKGLLAVYDDGWSDKILMTPDGLLHEGFTPETLLDGKPTNTAPIQRVPAPLSGFVGVWRLNKEPDGSYQYVTLQSNGRAFSTVNGGTEGKWKATEKGAECQWPDGWIDLIERNDQGWQKRSFVGTSDEAQADLSPAIRVGESRYMATTP